MPNVDETNGARRNESGMSRRTFLEFSGTASACLVAAGATLGYVGRAYPAADPARRSAWGLSAEGSGPRSTGTSTRNCVVTGVTDLFPGRRAGLKQHYKCDNVYDSLEVMLKEAKDIDAVAVFSGAGPRQARQGVHGARLARRLRGPGVPHARRGGHAQRGQGEDRAEVHDGRVELLQPGVHLRPELVPRRRVRRALLFGDRVLPPVVQPGHGAHRQGAVVLRARPEAVLAMGPSPDALSDPFHGLPRGRDERADHEGLVPRLARQSRRHQAATQSSPTTSTRIPSGAKPRRCSPTRGT